MQYDYFQMVIISFFTSYLCLIAIKRTSDKKHRLNSLVKNLKMVLDQILTDLRLLLGGIGQLELAGSSSKHTPQFFVPSGFFLTWYPFSSTFVEHQGLYPVTWLKSYVHAWYVLLFKSNLKGNTHGSLKTAFLLTKNEYSAELFPVLHSASQIAWI